MPESPEPDADLPRRMHAVEQQVVELRTEVAEAKSDAQAARVLAAGADRDVSEVRAELRAHTRALNALRETQVDQGRDIAGMRDEMRAGFADVYTEMRTGFATMAAGMAAITTLLELAESDEG